MSLSSDDRQALWRALEHLEAYRFRYPMKVLPDVGGAWTHIVAKADLGEAIVVGKCLLMFSVITPWYGNERVLQEELILSLHPDANPRAAVRELRRLEKVHSCAYTVAGNLLQDQRLTRLYEREGFFKLSDQLIRINNG